MTTPVISQADIGFDQGRHHRAKIGYVLLATEQTIEDDVFRLTPEGVGVHFTRMHIPDSITTDTLAAQVELLADAAREILPDGSLDVICYACTSGSLVIGEKSLQRTAKRRPERTAQIDHHRCSAFTESPGCSQNRRRDAVPG